MAEQVNNSNVDRKLIGGSGRKSPPSSATRDVVVENIAEKRYLWTARAFAIITAVSVCCNVVLLMTITRIVPLHRVEPFLLTFKNKQEQVYHVQKVNASLEDERAITEVLVRQYVLLRSTFDTDVAEMEARWLPGGALQEMSSPAVYADFLEKTANRAIERIRTANLRRDVRIITVNEHSRGKWQVEYETRDIYPSSTAPDINYWTATLEIAYRSKTVKYSERLKNPIGFTVTLYSLARGSS